MWGNGNKAEASPTPDPEGTIRIGGIKVTVAASKDNEVAITLHDKRIHHHALSTVIDAHLKDKGHKLHSIHSQSNPDNATKGFVDFPTNITLSAASPEAHIPATAQIEAECKELSAQITDNTSLFAAYKTIVQARSKAAIADRFRQQGGKGRA